MAVNYARISSVADKLIKNNGRDITLTKKDRTAADPAKPWRGGGTTTTSITVKGIVLNDREFDADDTLIRRGNRVALISAKSAASNDITTFDQMVDGTSTIKIVNVTELKPGPVSILYMLELEA